MRGDPNRNLVAALSYLFGFVTGLVILLIEKDDKFIRFHAAQSLLVFFFIFIFNIVVNRVLAPIDIFGAVSTFLGTVIFLGTLAIWAFSMYQAFSGKVFKWPIAGNMAEKMVK